MGLFMFIIAIIAVAIGFGVAFLPGANKVACVGAGLALGALLLVLSSSTVVDTRSVGVETSFGKPVGVLAAGYHWKRPWAKVSDWDGTIQTFKDDVKVRLANQTTAAVDASVQWQVDVDAKVLDLYKNYRSFDRLQINVVARQAGRSLNDVFGTYDPLAVDDQGHAKVVVSDLASRVETDMRGQLPAGITIVNVTIISIAFDPNVQAQINNITSAASATKVAQQQELTNQAIAKANQALAGNGANLTPAVLYQNCLNMTQAALKAGETLPVGWNCGNPYQLTVPAR